ncbi:SDR family NAD(P)-dependent oxidoreductase [Hyphomonas johnsonii]|uniref:Short-chain dehydrogenase/reductase SDR n=1 Tax=Hyphomonas johnsonii MHS-2 TaxID=1280950 RepID=A0A059FU40_9PROT|nr:SDR family oxidoreductase [Hyphomonas johnsonii]KCZ94220.1 short-chain dehydrogenase/reductase SDR [Hyphomonas johnsonii MHS-2]
MNRAGQRVEPGSIAVVTGASQGLGEAIGRRLAQDGWHVVLAARRKDKLDRIVSELAAADGSAESVVMDVSDPEQVAAVIRDVGERHGRIDGLVNNAGHFSGRGILDTKLEEFRRNLVMNLEAPFLTMQAVLPFMIERGRGAIVNIGSVSGMRASENTGGYGASKAGLSHLGAIVAMEMGKYNIRVNTVTPGSTWSPTFAKSVEGKTEEEIEAMQKAGTILGRFGQPAEIADAVAFLLSDEGQFITGTNLPVDGGAYWFRGGNRLIGMRD